MDVLTHSRRMLVIVAAALTFTCAANAAPVPIARYDVEQTPASGFGGWFHVYNGTITDLGRPFGGSASCSVLPCRVVNETGGSGTMNDGITAASSSAAQLFTTRNDLAGQPIVPKITLYLGGTFSIEKILIYGGGFPDIAGATVEFGQTSVDLHAVATGTLFVLDLTTTPLAGLRTDRVVLRNVAGLFFGQPIDQFSIAEIEIEGTAATDTTPPVITVPADPVIVNATGPNGAIASYEATAIDDVDGALAATCIPATGSVFQIGDTTVTCTASDAAGNTAIAGFTVHVKGAGEQVADLIAAVDGYDLRQLGTSLRDKLITVQRMLDANKSQQACDNLDSFLNQVKGQSGRGLTVDQATYLANTAARIKSVIGC